MQIRILDFPVILWFPLLDLDPRVTSHINGGPIFKFYESLLYSIIGIQLIQNEWEKLDTVLLNTNMS